MFNFKNPFENVNVVIEEKLRQINDKLQKFKQNPTENYFFIKGALLGDNDLMQLFLNDESINSKQRDKFFEQDKLELKYIEKLGEMQKALSVEKPTAEAYHFVSETLDEDEELKERFENNLYFPRRERNIYLHLEFLFNEDPEILLNVILPKLQGVKTKNMFSLLRFNIFDPNCDNKINEKDNTDVIKNKKEYFKFCETCIEEISRFGNMKETNGAFSFVGIDPKLEIFFNLSIKLLLTFLDMNLRKYLEIEITKEEIEFAKEVEEGHKLIEHARRVKKPMPKEEAEKLASELEDLIFFIERAKKKNLLSEIKDKKLSEYAKEQKTFLEEAQGEALAINYYEAKELLSVETGEAQQQDGSGLNYSNDENNKGDEEFNIIIDNSDFKISDKVKTVKEHLKVIQDKVDNIFKAKNGKEQKIAMLITDSEKEEPYYYKYINKILYTLKFFKFDVTILMKDFLIQCNNLQGFLTLQDDFFKQYANDDQTTVEDYIINVYEQLDMIYKKQFSKIKRFEDGFELSKQINAILLAFIGTMKEWNN